MSYLPGLIPTFWARRALWGALLALSSLPSFAAPAFTLAQVPLFLSSGGSPNILVTLDNSESMDATMSGKVISGNDPSTRSNIARQVLRDVIAQHRFSFNWGLGSFRISGTPVLWTTYGYFLGNAVTMLYTNDCTDIVDGVGVSASNGGLQCTANPEPANGFSHITFSHSGDDADVNDVLYFTDRGPQLYGIGIVGPCVLGIDYGDNHCYRIYQRRNAPPTTAWDGPPAASFNGSVPFDGRPIPFVATDAGFVPTAIDFPRIVWLRRGWGYGNDITGSGVINEAVVKSQVSTAAEVTAEATHHARLIDLLAVEDQTPASVNIKNAAYFTPLAGTLETARKYFSGVLAGHTSPIQTSCQKNFVVLATDGNPTGKKDGTQYDPAQWANTLDPVTGIWTYGAAVNDVFNELTALRTTDKGGTDFDVKTFVIGLGDTIANASSVAALNEMAKRGGTGTAYLASDPGALATAFASVVASIQSGVGSGAAVAVSSGRFIPGLALYQATFDSVDWSGNLRALPIDADGSVGAASWDAATQVNGQNWNTGRSIATYKPSAALGMRGVAFRWPANPGAPTATELDTGQITALNMDSLGVNDGYGALRLRYLRGETANELRNCVACTPSFRDRAASVLGDIVDSAPTYVGPPSAGYLNDIEPVAYSSFTSTHSGRTPYVFVGANDGMLHAFDASTGVEKFAYVPNLVFDSLSKLTATSYAHMYTVDGSPAVSDVYYGGAWHTLLVSGLRAGGAGLFALDVTDLAGITEANASSVVRWEFTDAEMGHVFAMSPPVKTNDGKWSVIVGNGYKSSAGKAVLFVIDAETGAIIKKIDTGQGSVASPNGLSAPAAIDINGDSIADVVYAGDLDGNLWKFDLSSVSPASWAVSGAGPLFASGKPITGSPDVALAPKGGYMVVFGTGRYMATADNTNTDTQTAFGIWDTADGTTVAMADLQQQTIVSEASVGANTFRLSTHSVGTALDAVVAGDNAITVPSYYSTKRGWYVNLPSSGERIVADAQIRGGRAIFSSIIPGAPGPNCDTSGSGWILEFDVYTGNRSDTPVFDVTNVDADVVVLDSADKVDSKIPSGWKISGGIPAISTSVKKETGGGPCIELRLVPNSQGEMESKWVSCGAGGKVRAMWRVVQ